MRSIIFLFFFITGLSAKAQLEGQPFPDSLVKAIPFEKDDTLKTRLYKKIVDQYANSDPAKAMQYAQQGMVHVKAMQWKKGIAVFEDITGQLYSNKGEYNTAINLYTSSYKMHLSNKDFYNAASTLNNLGTAYMRSAEMEKATEKYFQALKLAEEIKNQYLIALTENNIGSLYFNQNNYSKTLEYQGRALKIHTAEKNEEGIAASYLLMGDTYQQIKDTANARKYYMQALDLYKQANNKNGEATVYSNLSNIHSNLVVNLDYKLKAQAIWNNINPGYMLSITNMGNIALSYLDFARYDSLIKPGMPAIIPVGKTALLQKASEYLNQGIAMSLQNGDIGNYGFLTGLLAEVEVEKGNFKKAYYDAKTYHDINDSIFSQENKNKIAAIEGEREVAIRDKEIEVNKLALSVQRKQRIGLIAGIALLFIIGALLFRQNQLRKKTNTALLKLNNELDEANKVKAKFFAIISHDLRSPVARLVNFLHLQNDVPEMLSAEKTAAYQQKITHSAENLLDNMETILLWSKGQMENFTAVKTYVPVNELFDKILKAFGADDNISFSFVNPGDITVYSDENYLFTIMHNLTANAVKTLQQTKNACIEWRAWQINSIVFISIQDSGTGFSKEFLKEWEEPAASISGRKGFGMHIIKDMAKAIQCKVAFKNTNEGAVVVLQL